MQLGSLGVGGYGSWVFLALVLGLGWPARLPAPPPESVANVLSPGEYFDELFLNPNTRQVRPQYQAVYEVYRSLSEQRKREVQAAFQRRFGATIHPMPRVLTVDEHVRVREGIAQRARVLAAFLDDVHSGRMRFLEAGIMTREQFLRIAQRSGDAWFLGRMTRGNWAQAYAPDIIRNAAGEWVVLEDNTGDVGGRGDVQDLQRVFLEVLPEYRGVIEPLGDATEHHRMLVDRYRRRAKPRGGKIVMYATDRPYSDMEYYRLERIYKDLGVEVVSPYSRKRLRFDDLGAYLETPGEGERAASIERVGFVILGTTPLTLDWHHPAGREYGLASTAAEYVDDESLSADIREALRRALTPTDASGTIDYDAIEAALRRTPGWNEFVKWRDKHPKGLVDAVLRGRVGVDCHPGLDMVSDKEFYRYVDPLLELYFPGERPILRSARTEPLVTRGRDGRVRRRESFLAELTEHRERWVLKRVSGYGGYSVTVGAFVSRREFETALDAAFADDPEAFVAQEYFRMSESDGRLVDYRGYGEITRDDEWVGPTLWGRNAMKKGSKGKVNFSLGGAVSAIMMVETPCLADLLYRGRQVKRR